MVNGQRRNRRRRQASTSRVGRSTRIRRIVNRTSLGTRILPSVDPPEYTAGPWWPLTIVDSVKGDTQYTGKKIHEGILALLGLTGAKQADSTPLNFKFRLLSVRAWGLAKQPIQLSVTETHSTSTNWVKEINDFGTPLAYSRVGWRFGDVFVHQVHSYQDTSTLFFTGESGTEDKILLYIQVLIRVPNAPEPALVMSHIRGNSIAHMDV